jgi:hypothetical protein
MAEIIRNRTIRPSTRNVSSTYKIDTTKVSRDDTLIVNISHESKPFRVSYTFRSVDIADRNSIHFSVSEIGTKINIRFRGAQPVGML